MFVYLNYQSAKAKLATLLMGMSH